ncbi:MAG: orotate phosphoribosyltransferase [Chloroflexi bacterium]|nr:orotate phosphoribosyltransferase [Chloroflexota bacterium]
MSTETDQHMSTTMCVDDALNSAKALLARAKSLGAVQSGEFTLSSGQMSRVYFDGRLLSVDPECVEIISRLFLNVLYSNKLRYFGGPAVGAVPILGGLALLAYQQRKDFAGFFVRRESKQHGMYQQIEGQFNDGATVAVYDDTISTGQSLLEAIKTLEDRQATFRVAMCILDRQQGGSAALEEKNIPLFNILVRHEDEITVDEEKIRKWFSTTATQTVAGTPVNVEPFGFSIPSHHEEKEELLVTT